ncbi:MAG: flagellar basal body P-ring formation protein FlgA [Alphaproteobacteria bacterium]|nr:flagellar basal body P-ring formation protein FlgA [Alphaproteobacteria bacterium]
MLKLVVVLFALLFVPMDVIAGKVNNVDLVKAIKREFVEQGIANVVELEIFGGKTEFETTDDNVKILISNLKTDIDSNKFTSTAEIFADGNLIEKTELLGRFFIMKEVYLPARDIAKGEIVKSEDLKSSWIRENRIKNDVVAEADNIIGKQTVRLLKTDKVITVRDLRDEVIVKKGQEVTVIYKNKGLQITSKMEATEDAGKGKFIKLINPKSNKDVVAKVIDKNTAEIKVE